MSDYDAALARLREWLKPGDTVYTVLRHVSRSGMMRRISFFHVTELDSTGKAHILTLDANVETLLGLPRSREVGVKVGGCGEDQGFKIVFALGRHLFNDGYALKHEWL